MRLATLRYQGGTRAAVLGDGVAVLFADHCLGDVLARPTWRREAEELLAGAADNPDNVVAETAWAFAPLITRPGKIICVGLNYAAHIDEMGHARPEVPTLFAKFADAVAGARDDIRVPVACAQKLDYEGELAVIVGETCLEVDEEQASRAIAGYAIMNDFTQRDLQYATEQWLQGKTLQRASAFGPWMLTADAFDADSARVKTLIDGELRQDAPIADLVFSPAKLVSYISQFVQLNPGDVISTGTPAGVGHGMNPPTYLHDGQEMVVTIDGLGKQCNVVRINR
ncbi:MAG: fumarylacetoacetate hydrolase family protein [Corynebacterium sp.]|uniref:fumarylacetoacetate hydrolase family protein n=1 Tax=Corynebacterium sp. TaxID=1720 RepID=UPI0026DB6EBF|nr:fumarylacetoacetate hydrolase family protein [Corynebacterium sp.]MDO5030215.1 fumarylacetoacetate hydrolase family protein [Corynebacterium sp.]